MGKGTIISGGSDGQYQVSIEYNIDHAIAEKTANLAKIADLETQIAAAEDEKTKNTLKLQKASLEKRNETLDSIQGSETISAWCADLTEDLSGTVGTIEVPGESQAFNVRPGYEDNAAYNSGRDGQLVPTMAQTPEQAFYNLAMLPGWQKWKPTYRYATIDSIDTGKDTADITLLAATSTQQSLNVNPESNYTGVPVEYMSCNASAFTAGDIVLVQFIGQDKDDPKIIGFKDNPQPCGGLRVIVIEYYESFYNKKYLYLDPETMEQIPVYAKADPSVEVEQPTSLLPYYLTFFDRVDESTNYGFLNIHPWPEYYDQDYEASTDSIHLGFLTKDGTNTVCGAKTTINSHAECTCINDDGDVILHSQTAERENYTCDTYVNQLWHQYFKYDVEEEYASFSKNVENNYNVEHSDLSYFSSSVGGGCVCDLEWPIASVNLTGTISDECAVTNEVRLYCSFDSEYSTNTEKMHLSITLDGAGIRNTTCENTVAINELGDHDACNHFGSIAIYDFDNIDNLPGECKIYNLAGEIAKSSNSIGCHNRDAQYYKTMEMKMLCNAEKKQTFVMMDYMTMEDPAGTVHKNRGLYVYARDLESTPESCNLSVNNFRYYDGITIAGWLGVEESEFIEYGNVSLYESKE